MPKPTIDLTGQRFGRLLARSFAGSDERKYKLYECVCDCGTVKLCRAAPLLRGELKSCGCLLTEARARNMKKAQKACFKHGLAGTLLYQTWNSMMQRCYCPSHDSYPHYGARGIIVCDHLRAYPDNLLALIGDRPEKRHSIDRIDGTIGYTCGSCEQCKREKWPMNVKWSTPDQQALNRRSTVWININGRRQTCSAWAKELGRSCHWVRDHHPADAK